MWEWGESKSFDVATGFNHTKHALQVLGDYECIIIITDPHVQYMIVSID